MKKHSRIISVMALIMAITLLFTGCGFGGGDNTTTTQATDNSVVNDVVPDNMQVTDSVIVTPPSSTNAQTTASSSISTTASGSSSSSSSTSESTEATTNGNSEATTEAAAESTTEIKFDNYTVEGLQDLLFNTEDPNTAGKILEFAGFEYDAEQCIYYSQMEPLQRYFGFNYIYDMMAPIAGMYYDNKRIQFDYAGKDWMIQLWKGQYGITAGAEIGLYNKTDKIMQYDCASNDELITMSFDFYNQNEYVFSRGPEKHWWLTGFKVFHAGVPMAIDLDIVLEFPDVQMANAFEQGLKEVAKTSFLDPITYKRTAKTFKIHW
ncbi:MAG: DUF4474 domain-containing protein [Clostridia bacterium]|nr:DUF4474 domain-containing protein [Clostridia bacterium]